MPLGQKFGEREPKILQTSTNHLQTWKKHAQNPQAKPPYPSIHVSGCFPNCKPDTIAKKIRTPHNINIIYWGTLFYFPLASKYSWFSQLRGRSLTLLQKPKSRSLCHSNRVKVVVCIQQSSSTLVLMVFRGIYFWSYSAQLRLPHNVYLIPVIIFFIDVLIPVPCPQCICRVHNLHFKIKG